MQLGKDYADNDKIKVQLTKSLYDFNMDENMPSINVDVHDNKIRFILQ